MKRRARLWHHGTGQARARAAGSPERWPIADEQLSPALFLSPDPRGGADERAHKQIAEIDTCITAIDQRLRAEFRDIFALARPDPLSIEDATSCSIPMRPSCSCWPSTARKPSCGAFMRDVAADSRWRGTMAPRSARPIR